MLAPSPSFSTLIQGFLLLSTLFATAHATNVWATAPNTAVFYCGEGKGNPTGTKAMMWATKGAKTSMYATGRPEYQSMKTILMVGQTIGNLKIGPAESKLFAEGASGVVRLFEDKLEGRGMSGVWKMDEEPALLKNAKVTALHVLNPDDPSIEFIVWERKGGKVVYRDEKHKVTGLPISRQEDYDLAWQPPSPPGSPPRAGSPRAGSPRAGSPAPARAASPKAASPKAAAPKAATPKAGSPSRSSSKSPTGRKIRRSRQF